MKRIRGLDWLILIADIVIVNLSYFVALVLRFYMVSRDFEPFYAEDYPQLFLRFAPIYTVFCIVVFIALRMYGGMWRHCGVSDLNRIIMASVITTVFQVAGSIIILPRRMPISYYIMGAVLQFVGVTAIRTVYRLWSIEKKHFESRRLTGKNTLIVGVGESARMAIRDMEEKGGFRPVCLLDPGAEAYESLLGTIPTYGDVEQLETLINRYSVKYVYIAVPLLESRVKDRIRQICDDKGVQLGDAGYSLYLEWDEGGIKQSEEKETDDKDRMIPFSPPDISDLEIDEVKDAMRSGWITTGPRTKLLERRLAAYIETGKNDIDTESEPERWSDKVVCLSSCTAAEELNLRIIGIGEGDEVIVPAYTYTASASAAIHCGAKVRFVDINKDGDESTHVPGPDYSAIEKAITPQTKAIIAVDIAGIPVDYDKIYEIVERNKDTYTPKQSDGTMLGDLSHRINSALGRIAVVADCAHSLGASRGKRYTGRLSDFASFSFHAVKNFTTAEGGAATWSLPETVYEAGVTDKEIYHMYQLLSLHGQNKDALSKSNAGAWEYDIIGPWYKCNMTDIMAAIGLKQLDRYPGMLSRRRDIIRRYDRVCDELGIFHLHHQAGDVTSSAHLYMIRLPGADEDERNRIIEEMAAAGVSTNVHYKPLPMMNAYKEAGADISDFPNSYDYYKNLLTLPLYSLLTDEDVERVCEALRAAVLRE